MSFPRHRSDEEEGFECPMPITCRFPLCDCGVEPRDPPPFSNAATNQMLDRMDYLFGPSWLEV